MSGRDRPPALPLTPSATSPHIGGPMDSDHQQITDLIYRYAHLVDARDIDGVVACFTEDVHAEYNHGAVVVNGRDAFRRWFREALTGPVLGPGSASTHVMSNVLIDLDGDTAHVETSAVAYLAPAG